MDSQSFQADPTSIAIVMIGLLLLQSVFLSIILLQLIKQVGSLQRHVNPILTTAITTLASLRSLLTALTPTAREMGALQNEVISILDMGREAAHRSNELLGRSTALLRSCLSTADKALDDLLKRFSKGSFTVYQATLHPTHEASAIIEAVRKALSHLVSLRKEKKTPAWHLQDEDIFI